MAVSGRRGARRLLVQALYQHQVGGHGAAELQAQFAATDGFAQVDTGYFAAVLSEILADADGLDMLIAGAADRPVAQLDPVERAILWLGVAELRDHPDVPVRVVVNEAVELAKSFGAQDGYKYVNAVLDRVATRMR